MYFETGFHDHYIKIKLLQFFLVLQHYWFRNNNFYLKCDNKNSNQVISSVLNSAWITILTSIDLKTELTPFIVINNSHLTQLYEIKQWQISKVLQSAVGTFLRHKTIFVN